MRRNARSPIANSQYLAYLVLALLFLLAAPAVAQEPTPEPPVYVVQPGDTLYRIAQRFGTTVEAIAKANDFSKRLEQTISKCVT